MRFPLLRSLVDAPMISVNLPNISCNMCPGCWSWMKLDICWSKASESFRGPEKTKELLVVPPNIYFMISAHHFPIMKTFSETSIFQTDTSPVAHLPAAPVALPRTPRHRHRCSGWAAAAASRPRGAGPELMVANTVGWMSGWWVASHWFIGWTSAYWLMMNLMNLNGSWLDQGLWWLVVANQWMSVHLFIGVGDWIRVNDDQWPIVVNLWLLNAWSCWI